MIVAGIDPSLTSAGIAILKDGQPVHTSHHGVNGKTDGATYQSRNRRGRWTAAKVRDAAMLHGRPDLVLIEALPHHLQEIGVADRCYLWGKIYEAFDWPNIPIAVINPQTLKVWVTGKGSTREKGMSSYQRRKQDKKLMVDTIQSWWPGTIADGEDDEADALGLAAIGAFHLGDPMPFTPKPRHTTGLDKVQWPALTEATA